MCTLLLLKRGLTSAYPAHATHGACCSSDDRLKQERVAHAGHSGVTLHLGTVDFHACVSLQRAYSLYDTMKLLLQQDVVGAAAIQ